MVNTGKLWLKASALKEPIGCDGQACLPDLICGGKLALSIMSTATWATKVVSTRKCSSGLQA